MRLRRRQRKLGIEIVPATDAMVMVQWVDHERNRNDPPTLVGSGIGLEIDYVVSTNTGIQRRYTISVRPDYDDPE